MPIPRYTLADWTPDAGPLDDWLARWAARGWRPEHGYGVWVELSGGRVMRWAMIREGQED